jgi:hypothetical protein
MNVKRLLVLLLLAGGAALAHAQGQPATVIWGEWKEYWGTPGETDVKYNDVYRVIPADGGRVKVQILNKQHPIFDERLEDGVLRFTQKTSFEIQYALKLQPDGKWLAGTVTTPKKSFDVKWERLR